MKKGIAIGFCVAWLLSGGTDSAQAVLLFDQNVTPDVIFGSGNANGSFTVERDNSTEVGLRGKLRFDAANNNQPQNIFNSQGNGDYIFSAGAPNPLDGPLPSWADATTPIWNFEWSINVNYDGNAPGRNLGDAGLTYSIQIDFNPSAADIPDVTFDPINVSFADHSFGTNATSNGGGSEAANAAGYLTLKNSNNVAQNSWNMEFFDFPASPYPYNPNIAGIYTITLSAFDGVSVLASTSINVISAVPESNAFLLGAMVCGVIGAGVGGRRIWSIFASRG